MKHHDKENIFMWAVFIGMGLSILWLFYEFATMPLINQ